MSKYDRYNEVWYNFNPVYKDSIKNIPEGRNLLFYPQPRSIIISPDDRYAYVGIFGFGLIRIDSETGKQKFYEDNFNYVRGFELELAHKMVNEIEWIDEVNILVATGNGVRVFDTEKEVFSKDIFSGDNNESRLWVNSFEKITD